MSRRKICGEPMRIRSRLPTESPGPEGGKTVPGVMPLASAAGRGTLGERGTDGRVVWHRSNKENLG